MIGPGNTTQQKPGGSLLSDKVDFRAGVFSGETGSLHTDDGTNSATHNTPKQAHVSQKNYTMHDYQAAN